MNRRNRGGTLVGAWMLSVLATAVPASGAEIQSYATGSYAATVSNRTVATIKDTAGDNRNVYTNYYRGSSLKRLDNGSGVGTTVYGTSGSTITSMRACTEIDFAPDSCDSFRR